MIEKSFDVSFIANLAQREKQIQQSYRPIIAVHKWFARRPGTLFRGLLLSEFAEKAVSEAFYETNHLSGIKVADPFMGGGTPLIEANRLGCDVMGFDINPMSYWIVKQEIEHLNLEEYFQAATHLRKQLETDLGHFYRTRCDICGIEDAFVKYFLWVKVIQCRKCYGEIDLFPGYMIAGNSRHPKFVLLCPTCGKLNETDDSRKPGFCHLCNGSLSSGGPAKRNQCECPKCQTINRFPESAAGPPRHRLFALEYFCPLCKDRHNGRFFKVPDVQDIERFQNAEKKLAKVQTKFVPDDLIPPGDETNRLHRWGYTHYHQMFNARQLLGLEISARIIASTSSERIRNALATNLSDLLRYQNMLCRYDTMALKSLDIFSIHGFPVGLIQCESNFLGIKDPAKGTCTGSGGWANIIEKYRKAKAYCDAPFEVRHLNGKKQIVRIKGEWIGDYPNGKHKGKKRHVELHCQDAGVSSISPATLDAVLTDPPYFGNVQYAELMDFCYIWLRRLVGSSFAEFSEPSTRNAQELTVNEDMGRGVDHFAVGISNAFKRMALALKPGSPLAFTYHHNNLAAYTPIAVAILDAGMLCTASLPCPAEMGASIHINGTGSSIIDTIFVCRTTGAMRRNWIVDSIKGVAGLVKEDLVNLEGGNVKPTSGDKRCIAYGHLVRLAIWNLRATWDPKVNIKSRIAKVNKWFVQFGGWNEIEALIDESSDPFEDDPLFTIRDKTEGYGTDNEIFF